MSDSTEQNKSEQEILFEKSDSLSNTVSAGQGKNFHQLKYLRFLLKSSEPKLKNILKRIINRLSIFDCYFPEKLIF